jgi:membrane-associated protease RseP (regulator of RpoE activity)
MKGNGFLGGLRRGLPPHLVNVALFLATFLTTTAQGAAFRHGGSLTPLVDGLAYSVPLMAILVFHEFGHYFAARAHGVPASLPYFIPLPPPIGLLGTMGAVIFQTATQDRKKLIDIGAAGPLAGLVVAIPVLFYGLTLSEVKPLVGLGLQEGNSLLYALLKYAAKGQWLPAGGNDVILHPTAWAGWAGLLITMLNLLPIGQLDGGHVATAFFGNGYAKIARIVHGLLPVLAVAVFFWVHGIAKRGLVEWGIAARDLSATSIAAQAGAPWLVWFGVNFLLRSLSEGEYHPPVDGRALTASRAALFWVVLVAFVLVFMPVPLRISIGSADISPEPSSSTTVP